MADHTASDTAANRPQPVLYSQLVTVLAAGLGLLTAFGLRLTDDQRNSILAAVSALVPLIALAAAWWARRKVTPLADPRDDLGRRLVAVAGPRRPAEPAGPVIAPPGVPPLPPPPAAGRRRRDERGRWT